ncbi:MAG: NADH-quinone oxidoreductase subunit C [Candidatus Omnitrophota bacterium]
MTRQDVLDRIQSEFKGKIKNFNEKSPKRLYVDIDKDDVPAMVELIFKKLGARFNIASGVDTPEAVEILYHFDFDDLNLVVSIRTLLDRENPEIESVLPIMKGAEWIEREIHELFGVKFKNHPNMKPLLLPDNWPKGQYPLRRDFDQAAVEKELDS